MTGRRTLEAALVGGALLLAGCGQGDTDAGATATGTATPQVTDDATTSSPSPSPSATSAAPSPSASATTPELTDTAATEATTATEPTAAGCDPAGSDLPPEVPNGAERVRQVVGDLDADDTPDQLTTWAVTLSEDKTIFHLRVVTGSGFVAERELTEAGAMADVRPLGTVPIGDGHQAALVVEDVGASAELISVWGFHDWEDEPCSLGRLTIADDAAPVVFPVGATVGVTNGLACAEVEGVPTLAMRTATASEDGDSYDWQETHLYWEGAGALRTVSQDEGSFAADDDQRQDFASLRCPGIDL